MISRTLECNIRHKRLSCILNPFHYRPNHYTLHKGYSANPNCETHCSVRVLQSSGLLGSALEVERRSLAVQGAVAGCGCRTLWLRRQSTKLMPPARLVVGLSVCFCQQLFYTTPPAVTSLSLLVARAKEAVVNRAGSCRGW